MSQIVLCVEDNEQVQMFNKIHLERKGFTVKPAMTIAQARDEVNREIPGLIILDIHLPDGNGLDFLRELRKTSNVPVIALTNSKEDEDIVKGLESGCDDYMPKPYTFPVLCARIERLLRRASQMPEKKEFATLKVDVFSQQAFVNGENLSLAQKEFLLLLFFMENEGKIMGADYLYEKIWGQSMNNDNRTLKKHISAIRRKLEDANSVYNITNLRGEGYCFDKV